VFDGFLPAIGDPVVLNRSFGDTQGNIDFDEGELLFEAD